MSPPHHGVSARSVQIVRPFDDDWWNARILNRDGRLDLQNTDFTSGVGAWVRWRLVDDLMSRFYVDYGLEGIFGINQEDPLYQFRLSSPTCAREARYFGRVCANGPHVAVAEDAPAVDGTALTPYRIQLPVEGDLDSHSRVWDTYEDYLRAVIADLGLADAGVAGHERCFHRRGRSSAQLAFRLAVLLRTANGGDFSKSDRLVTVTADNEADLRTAAPWFREPLPDGAPRWLLVAVDATLFSDGEQIEFEPPTDVWVITNEGQVYHAGGTVNARALWRHGMREDQIVAQLTGMEATE